MSEISVLLNYSSLASEYFSPKYICNLILYLCIFLYITNANIIFHILFPILITNAIVGTILIIFYWDRMIARFIKKSPTLADDLKKIPHTLIVIKIACIILHWLPIIIFLRLDIMKTSPLSAMSAWILGLLFMSVFVIVLMKNGLLYENYGHVRKFTYLFILYPIILFIICQLLSYYF
jgi:hypothetical protein